MNSAPRRNKKQDPNGARALMMSIGLGLGLAFIVMLAAVIAPASIAQNANMPSVFGETHAKAAKGQPNAGM